MKSVKYPSNHWKDPHGTVEKENVKRVIASLDVKDNTVSETGIITVIQGRVSDSNQGELETTDIEGTKILTVFDSCSPVSTVRHDAIAEAKII